MACARLENETPEGLDPSGGLHVRRLSGHAPTPQSILRNGAKTIGPVACHAQLKLSGYLPKDSAVANWLQLRYSNADALLAAAVVRSVLQIVSDVSLRPEDSP
jgi:hypothetical protein